jgi:hypothetical protein
LAIVRKLDFGEWVISLPIIVFIITYATVTISVNRLMALGANLNHIFAVGMDATRAVANVITAWLFVNWTNSHFPSFAG